MPVYVTIVRYIATAGEALRSNEAPCLDINSSLSTAAANTPTFANGCRLFVQTIASF